MTVLDDVYAFIVGNAPKGHCDDCIANALNLTVRQHANHKTRALAKDKSFIRQIGECAYCKKTNKIVIRQA